MTVGTDSLTYEVLPANRCLYCHQWGIYLVSMRDYDFESSLTAVLFGNQGCCRHRKNTQMATKKKTRHSLWASFLRHVRSLPVHFPKRSNLPAWIRSLMTQLCFWTHHKPLKLGPDPASSPIYTCWNSCRFNVTLERFANVRQRPASHRSPSPRLLLRPFCPST